MPLNEGAAYNERLMNIFRGETLTERSVAAECITHDLWGQMRSRDQDMAADILEPLFEFMRAQTDGVRTEPMSLGVYLQYREKDVGRALVLAQTYEKLLIHAVKTFD